LGTPALKRAPGWQLDRVKKTQMNAWRYSNRDLLNGLWLGTFRIVWRFPDGRLCRDIDEPPAGILAGSFNPLHHGHEALKRAAERHLRGTVHFELTLHNADKPTVNFPTLERRLRQFRDESLALTAAPTFAEKAEILPNTVFVVGVDTAVRILDPRFYGDSEARLSHALESIARQGCRFLVAGRSDGESFLTLNDLEVPEAFRKLFEALPPQQFREDVSSSSIRRNKQFPDQ